MSTTRDGELPDGPPHAVLGRGYFAAARQARAWRKLDRATRPERLKQPRRQAVFRGVGWGLLIALLLPVAVFVAALLPSTGTGGSNLGTGRTQPDPTTVVDKRLQHWIAALVVVLVDGGIAFALWWSGR